MGRAGILGLTRAEGCPNLPQRNRKAVSTAEKSPEYQRFSSYTPTKSGPLWQIWTLRHRDGMLRDAPGRPHPGERQRTPTLRRPTPRTGSPGPQRRRGQAQVDAGARSEAATRPGPASGRPSPASPVHRIRRPCPERDPADHSAPRPTLRAPRRRTARRPGALLQVRRARHDRTARPPGDVGLRSSRPGRCCRSRRPGRRRTPPGSGPRRGPREERGRSWR